MYNYVVADDERHVRTGIVSLIRELAADFVLAGEAGTGAEAAELIRRHRPDLAFIDVRMPGGSGLEAIRETVNAVPGTSFVIVSSYSRFEYARQAVQLGAFDYLVKPVAADEMQELLRRVRAIRARHEVVSTVPADEKTDGDTAAVARRLMDEQFALGVGVSQIADQIGVTANYLTTRFHERYEEAPLSYLTRRRMEYAASLLESGLRVHDVAMRVGYRDSRHFSRRFSDHFGVSPSALNRRNSPENPRNAHITDC